MEQSTFGITDLSTGSAADATNGNATANNGSLLLFITATATDTVTVTRPEESSGEVIHVVNGSALMAGPFETDLYGGTVAYKAGATTTKILPVQMPDLP
jgi:hypothetical protein